jgi:fructoselysine-6-P-deglycase FrlB-like protein
MMDFIEFCEDVLEHPLSDWQKTYLTNMYDMVKTAKEENRPINIIMPGRGSSRTNIHLAAVYLASEYYKCSKGEKDG